MSDTNKGHLNNGFSSDEVSLKKIRPLNEDGTVYDVVRMEEFKRDHAPTVVENVVNNDVKIAPAVEDVMDDDDDDDDAGDESFKNETFFGTAIINIRTFIYDLIKKPIIKWIIYALVGIGFLVYYGFAMKFNNPFDFPKNADSTVILRYYLFNGNKGFALFFLTVVVILNYTWDNYLRDSSIWSFCSLDRCSGRFMGYMNWILIGLLFILCVIYLIIDLKDPYNLISLIGILVFVAISCFMSAHPSNIQWKTLVTGLIIQFILGVFVMRLDFGYQLFKFVGDQVSTFLAYTDFGSRLVFGDDFADHFFVFKAMPVLIFFSAIVNLLYYVGAIQYIILKLSFVINKLMHTSPTESINATANIFLGQTEAPLLIKPFLPKMTKSEIFAVMTGGFATVAGSVLAAYIGFGIPANQLITASIMAAPAGLAIAKVIHPETKHTKANWDAIRTFPSGGSNNIFEAFSAGAAVVVGPIGAIVSNLIAFTAVFQFLNAIIEWFFSMVELENFGLPSILSYLFWPFALVMGTAAEDCSSLAKLIGIKVFVNEFVAYSYLGETIKFRDNIITNSTYDLYRNGTLPIPKDIFMMWNPRSISISTYALCGFANVASIGIQIGGLTALAPGRAKVFAVLAFKAMIAGNIASFTNACIAGLLFEKL